MLRTWGCEEWGPWELGGCGQKQDVNYNMRVTGAFNDPLDRQIMERIQIQNFKGPVLMNRRSEMGGVRVERMQYRRWGGEWAGWRRLPPPTLQVTQETLSSWAGAAIFTPIEAKMWHLAICSPVSVPYQGGGTPLCSDLDQGAGEEAKARQVEPGGMEELWREGPSFGKPSHSISSSTERELLGSPLCSLSLSALQSCSNCSLSLFNLQSSLFVFFLIRPQCLTRIRMNWKYSPNKFKSRWAFACSQDKNRNHHFQIEL